MPKNKPHSLTLAIGATALASTLITANANENPFEITPLPAGYQLGAKGEAGAQGPEGRCGMAMFDTDNDGKISKEEFIQAHEKLFSTKDANNDGMLDKEEFMTPPTANAETKPDDKSMEGKCGEGKCGEGMCGAKQQDKTTEGKCGEGKCGEGKCGNAK